MFYFHLLSATVLPKTKLQIWQHQLKSKTMYWIILSVLNYFPLTSNKGRPLQRGFRSVIVRASQPRPRRFDVLSGCVTHARESRCASKRLGTRLRASAFHLRSCIDSRSRLMTLMEKESKARVSQGKSRLACEQAFIQVGLVIINYEAHPVNCK